AETVEHFCGSSVLQQAQGRHCAGPSPSPLCLADVRGQPLARRALEIAAAGAHSLLMSGSPGTGKSMLAHRLPGLLPRLTVDHVLEVAALASLNGTDQGYSDLPPFRAPHHSASLPALVGGGDRPPPCHVSLAH